MVYNNTHHIIIPYSNYIGGGGGTLPMKVQYRLKNIAESFEWNFLFEIFLYFLYCRLCLEHYVYFSYFLLYTRYFLSQTEYVYIGWRRLNH